jgi:hypothetical protein
LSVHYASRLKEKRERKQGKQQIASEPHEVPPSEFGAVWNVIGGTSRKRWQANQISPTAAGVPECNRLHISILAFRAKIYHLLANAVKNFFRRNFSSKSIAIEAGWSYNQFDFFLD